MSGRFKFVADWSTGKVYSERALKVVNNDKATQIAEENLIVLNPEEKSEDKEVMVTKMLARRARAKALKKAAKVAKRKHGNDSNDGDSGKFVRPENGSTSQNVLSNKHTTITNGESDPKKLKSFASQKDNSSTK